MTSIELPLDGRLGRTTLARMPRRLLVFVLFVVGLLVPTIAMARTAGYAGTRVGATGLAVHVGVGLSVDQAAEKHRGIGFTCDEIASGSPHAAGGGGGAARSFFEGTRYTPKGLQQMRGGVGEFHSFPESVTAFESAGTVRTITGGDGVARQMLEIPGSYATSRGTVMDGVFQFIKEADGAINHRLFVPRTP